MAKPARDNRTIAAVEIAVAAARDKQADDVVVMDMRGTFPITDYFIVMGATNTRKIRAIVRNIEEELDRAGLKPYMREGTAESAWVLLDYIDFVIHVFRTEEREFYRIEQLWKDVPLVKLT